MRLVREKNSHKNWDFAASEHRDWYFNEHLSFYLHRCVVSFDFFPNLTDLPKFRPCEKLFSPLDFECALARSRVKIIIDFWKWIKSCNVLINRDVAHSTHLDFYKKLYNRWNINTGTLNNVLCFIRALFQVLWRLH